MTTCSLGASNIKLSRFDLVRARIGYLPQSQHCGIRAWTGGKQLQYAGVTVSHKSKKTFNISCGPSSETATEKETKSPALKSKLIPNSSEIESLVSEICDTTSIAEFELKLGGFRLYLKRDLSEENKSSPSLPVPSPVPDPTSAPVSLNTTPAATDSNGSVSSTALTISKPSPSPEGIQSFLDRAADEGLVMLQSPRVGFFRRSRTIKGKRAPPSCKEKQIVKEGQVICYIEQLGGELPIESDVSGEVIKILREDGEPVGYGDALIAILPSFPGIKKLQ